MEHVVGVEDDLEFRFFVGMYVVDFGDVGHDSLEDVLEFGFDECFGDGDVHFLVFVPVLDFGDPSDLVVVFVLDVGVVDQTDEGLVEVLLGHDVLAEEGNEAFQGEHLADVLLGVEVSMYTDIG